MTPKITQIDAPQVSEDLKLVGDPAPAIAPGPGPAVARMRPELRQAFLKNWERYEEAYRYLGR